MRFLRKNLGRIISFSVSGQRPEPRAFEQINTASLPSPIKFRTQVSHPRVVNMLKVKKILHLLGSSQRRLGSML